MSDLSNLLGDVYGSTNPDGPPVRREGTAAERTGEAGYADRSRIESVFNSWEPAPQGNDDDLSAALSAALVEPQPVMTQAAPVAPAPAPVAPVAAPKPTFAAPQQFHAPVTGPMSWDIGDDDIFPLGKAAKKSKKK